jgi:hypothetical protein
MDFGAFQQVPGMGRNGNDSGNWPVLLVRKKKALLVSPELDAAWFGGKQRQSELVDCSDEAGSFQLVSRRRLRWAHALFALAFGAVAALLIWEARTHFGV